VSASDDIPGLGKADDRPQLNGLVNLASLPLTPVEAFVLSRIDGVLSYADICQVTGLGVEQTLAMLRKLKRDRIILGPGEAATPVAVPPAPAAGAAPDGPARVTGATARVTGATAAVPEAGPAREAPPLRRTGPVPVAAAPVAPSLLERLDDGSPVDPAEVEPGPDLDPVTKARIIRVHRRLRTLSGRDLLGLPPGADKATAKKAYFAASKELHPDRYFGKDIGPFRRLLNDIFAQLARGLDEI
jgi:hypothetical protein